MSAAKTLISEKEYFSFRKKIPTKRPYFFSARKSRRIRIPTMYARTNTGSTHGDFQDRNGVNYVTSTESFGHCSQLFWKKDPNDSGVRKPAATTVSSRAQQTNSYIKRLMEQHFTNKARVRAFFTRGCWLSVELNTVLQYWVM